ncbi:210_t:CDS:1, partial [Funneliformis caledonium]
ELWKLLKDNVQHLEAFSRTVNELKQKWEDFDSSIFEKLATSMPRRINAVLKARAGQQSTSVFSCIWRKKSINNLIFSFNFKSGVTL